MANLKVPPSTNILRQRSECPYYAGCKARLPGSPETPANVPINAALDIRGGSSYGDGYNDGYGNYRDDRGDDERGYNDVGGRHNRNGYDHDDREQEYAPSNASGNGQDRYYGNDNGSGRRKDDYGYYDDEGRYHEDYDDQGSGLSPRRKSKTKLPTVLTSSNRKLGTIFLSAGAAFTALGITLFFNKTLMRLGNLLFVAGVPLMIGPGRTIGYFLQPKKARATGCLGCGVFFVLVGHPVIGILLEVFGLLNLFGNMFPLVMMMAKNMPIIGKLFGGSNSGSGGKKKESRYDEDRYYEEEHERGYQQDEQY